MGDAWKPETYERYRDERSRPFFDRMSGSARWRVRVGPWPTRDAGERAADRLKREERLPTWVLEEDR